MTRRRDLERHLRMMGEIKEIMTSMKTLALLETHKLAHRLGAQHRVIDIINAAAADFSRFFPLPASPPGTRRVYLLLGSERGFCGDFNEKLLTALDAQSQGDATASPLVLAVGHKLCSRLGEDARVAARLDGATVAEEVARTLNRVIDTLSDLQQKHGAFGLTVLHHRAGDRSGVETTRVLPPFEDLQPSPSFSHPPRLNLKPSAFVADLLDHYLFAVLHELAYASLMAENQKRMEHLEQAVRRLEQQSADMARRRNILRQEEITEEIEVIMLSVEAMRAPS